MMELRRKVLLPAFQLSELALGDDPRALTRRIKQGKGHCALIYHYRFVLDDQSKQGFDYNLFPVVLDRNSAPWALGALYILAKLEAESNPVMSSYHALAGDLGAFKEWLDNQEGSDDFIFHFPKIKLRRPTYRYYSFLQQQIQSGEIKTRTAKRRMAVVIAFYRWLIDTNYFEPDYPPWEEAKSQLVFKTCEGLVISKNFVSTNLSIHVSKSDDPYAGTIQDGGRLRPLTGKEQNWILNATKAMGNTECYLIQLFMLATGARIQTAGTLRLRHFAQPKDRYAKSLIGDGKVVKINAGPGTGIDTKNNKVGLLQVPSAVYELLNTYAFSERANIRRERFMAKHGMHTDPYLFITLQGNPYYAAREESLKFNPNFMRRHEKTGQTVRQFISDQVIPCVRDQYDKHFHYSIHDLRASFGMNMTELLMEQVQKGTITLSRTRTIVKELLWHTSLDTTDLYLNFRSQMDAIYEAVNGYGEQLQVWIEQAMKGMEVTDE